MLTLEFAESTSSREYTCASVEKRPEKKQRKNLCLANIFGIKGPLKNLKGLQCRCFVCKLDSVDPSGLNFKT